MKRKIVIISLILMISILTLSACDLVAKIPGLGGIIGGEQPHEHSFVEGKCECGESDPNYQPPHEHKFVEGKCECGESDPNYQPPHEHKFVEGKCECGESDPNYQPPHEHSYDGGVITTEPTCTAKGVKTFTCSCGDSYTEDVDMIDHSYGEGVITTEPTCTAKGVKTFTCSCGDSYTEDVDMIDHSFVNGKCQCGAEDPDYVPEEPDVLDPITVYLVGDSTVCAFSDGYYYPRYGYGTQLQGYLAAEATVVNLALSGRSSKSFITEANYETLKNSLKEGDILIIGFGHNDEKSDDAARFTDASKDYTDPTSFGYYLNEYYIKLAEEKGATPILCTPVVRAKTSDDYSGNEGHVTATGDYAQAIRDLGAALEVSVIDLTAITKAEYSSKGYETAKLYHAVTVGMLDSDGVTVVPNWGSIDKTHLNIYGAKFVAYSLATELAKLEGAGRYVLADIVAPTEADLVVNPSYVFSDYEAPDLSEFGAQPQFGTITEGWYGTAFGDTGGDPNSTSNGYIATETESGVFQVGTPNSGKGKFSTNTDGFAFLFTQVEADKNFTISVTATIMKTASTHQVGFGLMLRDDVYLPVKDASITSNYVTAGILCNSDQTTNALFSRENAKLNKGDSFESSLPAVDDVYTMSIERVGQSITVTVTSGDDTVSTTHYDFDLFAKDNGYMYVGMFANRGTVVEFTNVEFKITGTSQGA